MPVQEFIIALFCRIDDVMHEVPKHPQASLHPSEVVTLAILFAIKGVGGRPFYRWVAANHRDLFPNLPERTRLFRLFETHQDWAGRFLAEPTLLGVIDSYGIEFIHPVREGRCRNPLGKKGLSNRRWIVGGKLCLLVNQWGLVTGWDCATANVHDTTFHPLIQQIEDTTVVFADNGFHASQGDPSNLKVCPRYHWNDRMLLETVLSMLTVVSHFKKRRHREWSYFRAMLAFTMAAFNLLVQWDGLKPDDTGFVSLSIAQFSL